MASRSMAPGASLLRASRVFSIPAPLPRPMENLGSTDSFNSDTATLPHPIQQSITTPQSSLERGDWGFKRLLPLRSTTKSSTPVIRVESIDTFEQITEFTSAADHTLSLQKWQEMNIAITTPKRKRETNFPGGGSGKSVFEDDIDCTVHEKGTQAAAAEVRWKFDGPWLAGQTEGEFNEYMVKDIRKKRREFRNFLRTGCADAINEEAQKEGSKDAEAKSILEPQDVTEEQLTAYIQTLRESRKELFSQIRVFLDLPPSPASNELPVFNIGELLLSPSTEMPEDPVKKRENSKPTSPYAESGPPQTHPSAGLSYSRTSSKLFNHPVYGPQKFNPPVEARVVAPTRAGTGTLGAALGVGGFVTRLPASEQLEQKSFYNRKKGTSVQAALLGLSKIDPDNKEGAKIHVQPTSATVDSKGRVMLNVSLADQASVAVKDNDVDSLPPPPKPKRINAFGMARTVKLEGTQKSQDETGYGL